MVTMHNNHSNISSNQKCCIANEDHIFLLLKPAAMNDRLNKYIKKELTRYGQIIRQKVVTPDMTILMKHYSGTDHFNPDTAPKHLPALLTYLAGKPVESIQLRLYGMKSVSDPIHTFKKSVIGPSDPRCTHSHHLRNIACSMQFINHVTVPDHFMVTGYQPFAMDNLIHGSSNRAEALRECALWFN